MIPIFEGYNVMPVKNSSLFCFFPSRTSSSAIVLFSLVTIYVGPIILYNTLTRPWKMFENYFHFSRAVLVFSRTIFIRSQLINFRCFFFFFAIFKPPGLVGCWFTSTTTYTQIIYTGYGLSWRRNNYCVCNIQFSLWRVSDSFFALFNNR